jgi:hypothetical protein
MMNLGDMQLRQYIDQIFMRYDYNGTGTLNLPELHVFLNELFQMSGYPRVVTYQEAYSALMAMDSNRDGQINKYELFNLFRYMTQPGFQPLPYSYGSYNYGMGGMGMGGMGGMGMGGMGMGGMGMGGMGMGGVGGYGTGTMPYGGSYTTTTVTTSYPAGTGYGGIGGAYGGGFNSGWTNSWGGW